MKDKTLHNILFWLLMAFFCLPALQQCAGLFHFKELEGFVATEEPVKLSWKTLKDDSFQKYCGRRAKNGFGFREFYIRTYNQLMYSCFNQSTNDHIVIGKNGELFLRQYTDVTTGKALRDEFGTVDSAQRAAISNVQETKRWMDTLRARGIQLLVVLAPDKPAIYPEYLPDDMQRLAAENPFSLQETYAELYRQYGIPHIHFTPIFQEWKKTTPYPLYTRYGTHWAHSTIPAVTDTILRKMEELLQRQLPSVQYVDSNLTTRYQASDRELEGQLNLLFPLRHQRLPMPTFALKPEGNDAKPNLLVIGDSYFTQLEGSPFMEAFNRVDYWKYNKQAFSTESTRSEKVVYIDRYKILNETDIVVVMFTSMYAYKYFFGFLETLEETLQDGPDYDWMQEVRSTIQRIKADPVWYESVKRQAEERQITVEQSLLDNAKYVYEMEHQKLNVP